MSKPSEKAMQLAHKIHDECVWADANGSVRWEHKHAVALIAAELEAQHRKTWALAINKLRDEWKAHKDDHGMMEDLFVYHLNRCPQITNESKEDVA